MLERENTTQGGLVFRRSAVAFLRSALPTMRYGGEHWLASGQAGTQNGVGTGEGYECGMSHEWSVRGGFFANADFDYEARIVLGAAASGLGDVGLVLAALDQIADGDSQSWLVRCVDRNGRGAGRTRR
jgi:hypothetical protein